jgi:hypothetical protein
MCKRCKEEWKKQRISKRVKKLSLEKGKFRKTTDAVA